MLREVRGAVALEELGVVRVHGIDAAKFLQGQLSQDIARVSVELSLLAGLHNAQGRVVALTRLILHRENDLLVVLPRELAPAVVARLQKFVLRAKVALADASAEFAVQGYLTAPSGKWPRLRDAQCNDGAARIICVAENPAHWLRVVPRTDSTLQSLPAEVGAWERAQVAAGEPQVYAATTEAFVSQMLNLDALGAIAFDKGCYTGQEIIARAHYRGRMKRRMQRFGARTPSSLEPGSRGRLQDGRSFIVVRSARKGDSVEFLAVAPLDAEGGASEGAAAEETAPALDAVQHTLPYELPA